MMIGHEYHLKKDREVCPYNGKTVRIKGLGEPLAKNIEFEAKRKIVEQEGSTLIPVTNFDSCCHGFDSHGRMLGTKGRWDDLPSQLSLHSVKETVQYNRDLGTHCVSYEVPVVGTVLIPQVENDSAPILNRSDTIYVPSSIGLTEFGRSCLKLPTLDSDSCQLNARFGTFRHRSSQWQSCDHHRLCHAQSNMNVVSEVSNTNPVNNEFKPVNSDGVTIDLLRPRLVTHIGTLGSIPSVSWQQLNAQDGSMGWVVVDKPGWITSFYIYVSESKDETKCCSR